MSTLIKKKVSTSGHRNFKVNLERYESAQEVVKHCQERPMTSSEFHDQSKASFGSWEGVKSYNEALDLLKNGYQPTVEKLKDTVNANRTGYGKRISFVNDIQGFAPIVPLALKGVPQSMINMTMKQIKAKVIDVYYDMTTSAGTSSETIIENGQKLLGAIMGLEKQGYKFNLYAMQSYADDNTTDMLVVKIKSSDRPIDLKRISFPLTHTAFFRVIGFDWYSKVPDGKYRSGYGRALKFIMNQKELDELSSQMFGKNAVLISGRHIQERDDEYIKEVLTNDKSKN